MTWIDRIATIPVFNNSGEDIPPYAALELDSLYESNKSSTVLVNSEFVVSVKKPTAASAGNIGLSLFNGPQAISIGGYGSATAVPIFLALYSDTSGELTPGDTCGPVASSWYVTKAGIGLIFKSLDTSHAHYVSASIRTILVERAGGGGGSNIFGYVLKSNWSGSSPAATADITDAVGVVLLVDMDINDPKFYMSDQVSGDDGHCYEENGAYYTIQAPCTNPTPSTGGGGGTVPVSSSVFSY